MIIKQFNLDDLGCFMPNSFSDPDAALPMLAGHGNWEAFSGWGSEYQVLVIAAVREYWRGCYSGFFLVSAEFTKNDAQDLREYVREFIAARNIFRLQTESASHPLLREWHRYLGFNLEGVKEKMMFNRDYDMWAIVHKGA